MLSDTDLKLVKGKQWALGNYALNAFEVTKKRSVMSELFVETT